MSSEWANRQRRTNYMTRQLAAHILSQNAISARQIYGLSKLAWITNGKNWQDERYIFSTKIPALGDVFEIDLAGRSLEQAAKIISTILNDAEIIPLIINHTGFTNFYKAYRNSVLPWIDSNLDVLISVYKFVYELNDAEDRVNAVKQILTLPGIPKANNPDHTMKPEYFVTPALFALDPEIRFPIINGRRGVRKMLKELNVNDSSLLSQYHAMAGLIGKGGINDAADLDQVKGDLKSFFQIGDKEPTKKLLEKKDFEKDNELMLKDEEDVIAIQKSITISQKRIHNKLTNKLRLLLTGFTLLESRNQICMFDVQVKNYDHKGNDLIIEVKSSLEIANIRMAVGQLYHYWFNLEGPKEPHLAILLPSCPSNEIIEFLKWTNIGLLWFDGDNLYTNEEKLGKIALKS